MKPAPFEYFAPRTLEEALSLLARHGYEAKPLAGGQSLIPTMNFRLAQPTILVDLNGLEELERLEAADAGGLCIGAMVRQRAVERSALVRERAPLVAEAMPYVAHPQIRNRGTVGGSLAHADPAAELPAVMLALKARFRLEGPEGARWVDASDFFLGPFSTALAEDELLAEIVLPRLPARTGTAFLELARRHGDYALVGVAAVVSVDEEGRCREARLALLSVGDRPGAASSAAASLAGELPTEERIADAARLAASCDIEPLEDIHASPAYRRRLAEVLTRRALTEAFARARSAP
ncbi:MAG: FAD binding domain-containing protein [Gemmatimonadota bacterium]